MNRMLAAVLTGVFVLASHSAAFAQLLAAKDGPIVYGHHHINASNVEDTKKFWASTLGGVVTTIGTNNLEIIKFPNALLFWRAQAPKGPTKGTTFDHMGFSVPDLRQVLDKVRAGGYRIVTTEEAPSTVTVKDDIGQVDAGGVTGIAYVLSPDGVKVELVEMKKQTAPIVSHHVHFFGQQRNEMREWYAKVFGATLRPGEVNNFVAADLPGIGLNFSPSKEPTVGTQGRALDHIGFEVKNLEEFCKKLEAQGIKLTVSYRKIDALNTAIAFVTDPWGTSIELTEGLAQFP